MWVKHKQSYNQCVYTCAYILTTALSFGLLVLTRGLDVLELTRGLDLLALTRGLDLLALTMGLDLLALTKGPEPTNRSTKHWAILDIYVYNARMCIHHHTAVPSCMPVTMLVHTRFLASAYNAPILYCKIKMTAKRWNLAYYISVVWLHSADKRGRHAVFSLTLPSRKMRVPL